ncbi:MAG: acylphosphatase [Thermofilum sp.]|jgi:acylphosphatase|nr:acylphosphatase [Thermofilum sp.]
MTKLVRARILVSGLVQGVFYRATMREVARSLGVTGWVRNLPDGRVEAVAEGDEDAVKKLIEWAKQGPPLARVEKVDVEWKEYRGEYKDFYIRW